MTEYTDIIERLTKATGPDRELDALIAFGTGAFDYKLSGGLEHCRIERGERITNDEVDVVVRNERGGGLIYAARYERYTASLDASIALVERMLPGWWWLREDGVSIRLVGPDNNDCYPSSVGRHHIVPIAILLALFRALEAKEAA